MPIREMAAGDRASIASCVTVFLTWLQGRGELPPGVEPAWTVATVTAFSQAGYRAHGYVTAAGRVDAVCVWGIEQHTRAPSVAPEPWWVPKILAVRVGAFADVDHERYLLRAAKLALPAAVNLGCVGSMVEVTHPRLRAFLASWARADFEPAADGRLERCWLRASPGLPEFTPRAEAAG